MAQDSHKIERELTFASKVKGEISRNKGLIARNKKAFTYGMLLCGKSFSASSISMTTENKHVAKLYARLIFQQIPMQTSVTTREYNGNFQQPTYAVSVDDEEDRKTILAFFGHQQGAYNLELLEEEQHRHAFLAGAFLSCSNISDPRKDYHLEFVLAEEQTALFLMQVLGSLSLNFKRTTRRGQQIVYCKDSKSIEELLTMVGATGAMMDVVNVKIYKDMRNKVNRVTNCETSNIEKTVSAATVQAADIRYLKKIGLFETMEPALKQTAQARLQNPDMSLRELGELLGVSRSGINHRLQKISLLARQARSEASDLTEASDPAEASDLTEAPDLADSLPDARKAAGSKGEE